MPRSKPRATAPAATAQRWYPTTQQLSDPATLERSFRQLLTQHYALQDEVAAMKTAQAAGGTGATATAPKYPPGSGPTDTQLCGLHVEPVDPGALADGTKLTYVKKTGTFKFM